MTINGVELIAFKDIIALRTLQAMKVYGHLKQRYFLPLRHRWVLSI